MSAGVEDRAADGVDLVEHPFNRAVITTAEIAGSILKRRGPLAGWDRLASFMASVG
jgi:hypothetical protein